MMRGPQGIVHQRVGERITELLANVGSWVPQSWIPVLEENARHGPARHPKIRIVAELDAVTCQDLPKLLDEVFGISEAHQIAKAINAHDAKLAQTSAFGNRRKGRGACHPDGKRPTRRSEPERPAKLWEAWLHSLKVVGLAVFELPAHEIAPSRSGIEADIRSQRCHIAESGLGG